MIYLAVIGGLFAIFGFWKRVRSAGAFVAILDVLAAGMLGWLAGLLIGFGARVGMWSIPFFNGAEPRITFDGTFRVIITFALFGIGLGILYELVFRDLFRTHGLLFGALVTLVSTYPVTAAGVQQLTFSPSLAAVAFFGVLITAIMFVPFSIALEFLISRVHSLRSTFRHAGSR